MARRILDKNGQVPDNFKPPANIIVRNQRIESIIADMGKGLYRFQLLQKYMPIWNMTEDGVQVYISAAIKIIKEGFSKEDLLARYDKIWHQTCEENPEVARKTLDSIAKLKHGDEVKIALKEDIIVTFGETVVLNELNKRKSSESEEDENK